MPNLFVFYHNNVYVIWHLYTLMEDNMRTNIIIDDTLMSEALKLSGYKTKKETVEEGLKLLIALKSQARARKYRGELKWEGDLDKMRADK
jgi:Arc/MetJ family transcription regulator